jgi:hypothetical protein
VSPSRFPRYSPSPADLNYGTFQLEDGPAMIVDLCGGGLSLQTLAKSLTIKPRMFLLLYYSCLAPDFLDTELSVFMQRLRVQEAAGAPGLA